MTENKQTDQTPNQIAQEKAKTLSLIIARAVENGTYGGMNVIEVPKKNGQAKGAVELQIVMRCKTAKTLEDQIAEELKQITADQIPVKVMTGRGVLSDDVDAYRDASAPSNMSVAQAVAVLRGVAQEKGAIPVVLPEINIRRPHLPPWDVPEGEEGTPILDQLWVEIIPEQSGQRRKIKRGNEAVRALLEAGVKVNVRFVVEEGFARRVQMPHVYKALLQAERSRR